MYPHIVSLFVCLVVPAPIMKRRPPPNWGPSPHDPPSVGYWTRQTPSSKFFEPSSKTIGMVYQSLRMSQLHVPKAEVAAPPPPAATRAVTDSSCPPSPT